MNIVLLFSLGASAEDAISAICPDARVHPVGRDDGDRPQRIAEAEILVGWPGKEDLAQASCLRWLQLPSAGAAGYARDLPPQVQLTNARGVFGIPIAEHVMAMMLALTRGVPAMVEGQRSRTWRKPDVKRLEVFGKTMGIVGLGDIGTETARRAKAFGMRVIANRRSPGAKPDFVDALHGPDGLDILLAEADHLVVTLPGTRHTEGLIGRAQIARMKPGAFIYNVGRGSTIDEAALAEALASGRLAGAGLDVFATEPLPQDSPLWGLPNVLVSPHCSGGTPEHRARTAEIFLDNLRRFVDGRPLQNVVDRELEY